jgi:glycerol-3-phosphate dehydrogenase (NAD(P)+)
MARVTVFGAGAMGTAIAMHLVRAGNDTVLWASPFDERVLPDLLEPRKHPLLPAYLPDSLKVMGPDQLETAADGLELAVMGAHSGGARSLARAVLARAAELPLVLGVAKGLEPGTGRRMSEVYAEEVGHRRVATLGGPCLAPEIAEGLPSAAVVASQDLAVAEEVARCFRTAAFQAAVTDDVLGLEWCTVGKNVAAIGMGMVDGIAKLGGSEYRNAKAALFAQAVRELVQLVVALGGRAETAYGLAGLGDALVTSLGGRNRLYGEMIGEGADPERALSDLVERGMTVEGVESTREVRRLAAELGLELPYHAQVEAILFDGAPAVTILECMKG